MKRRIIGIFLLAFLIFPFGITNCTVYADEIEIEEDNEGSSKEVEVQEDTDNSSSKKDTDSSSKKKDDSSSSKKKDNSSSSDKKKSSNSSGSKSNSSGTSQNNVNNNADNDADNNDADADNTNNDDTDAGDNTTEETTVAEDDRKDINDIDVFISQPGIKYYTGASMPWAPIIKNRDYQLNYGTDYELQYDSTDFTNAQVIHVTVKGIGAFKGKVTVIYRILPRKVTYTAKAITKKSGEKDPKLTYEVDGYLDPFKDKITISREEGEEVGQYVITISGPKMSSDHNVIATYKEGKFTIE